MMSQPPESMSTLSVFYNIVAWPLNEERPPNPPLPPTDYPLPQRGDIIEVASIYRFAYRVVDVLWNYGGAYTPPRVTFLLEAFYMDDYPQYEGVWRKDPQ